MSFDSRSANADQVRVNLVSSDALLLARHDLDAAGVAGRVAHEIKVTAAPRHPGDDPVSRNLVDGLVTVLRGPGGVQDQLAAVVADFEANAEALQAAARTYQDAEAEARAAFNVIRDRLEG